MTVEPFPQQSRPAAEPSRRQVLCGLAVALLAPGALASACGGESGTPAGSGGTGAGATTTGGAAPSATSAPGGGATANAIAKLSDVPVGGGIIVDGPRGSVLLVQPTAGEVKGYDPTCTHQGTTVGEPNGGVITCPNHGSQFDPADGAPTKGPATSPLAAVDVRVDGEDVVLA